MKLNHAIAFVRQLQRYSDHKCTRPDRRGYYARNVLIKPCTKAELREALGTTDSDILRYSRVVWADLATLKAEQRCISPRRLVYQLRRHPLKKLPTIVTLKDGTRLVWDGNHRANAAILLGRTRIKCSEIRKAA
jgi:hypothetical protein